MLHRPFVAALPIAAVIPRRREWLLLVGFVGGVGLLAYALVFASGETAFLFSDRELFVALAIYWSFWWAVGVGAGVGVRHGLAAVSRHGQTAR